MPILLLQIVLLIIVSVDSVIRAIPKSFVILSNLQSGSNIGSICRNCLSFGVSEVLIVGRSNYKGKMRLADQGAKEKLKFKVFSSTGEAVSYLKDPEIDAEVIGLEIMDESECLKNLKYSPGRNTAFIFGNEGKGLSDKQRSVCDRFCYIPQFSTGMASINVSCCSAIILHHFASSAGYEEAEIIGEKFAQ